MRFFTGFLLVMGLILFMVVSGITAQRRLYLKTNRLYQDLAHIKGGQISTLPFPLGGLWAFAKPVDGGTAYLCILPKSIQFLVVSPQLKESIPIWIKDSRTISPGSFQLGQKSFDAVFSIWKGPKDRELIQETLNEDCQKALLRLQEEAKRHAVNTFVELIHVKPREDTLSLKLDNYQIKRRFFQVELEPLSVYEKIFDVCMEVYEAFGDSKVD